MRQLINRKNVARFLSVVVDFAFVCVCAVLALATALAGHSVLAWLYGLLGGLTVVSQALNHVVKDVVLEELAAAINRLNGGRQ